MYFVSLLLLDIGIFTAITNGKFTGKYTINQQEQLSRINNYEIVQPYRVQDRNRRDVSTETRDGHLQSSTFVIPGSDGKEFILDVDLNENLFPESYVIISYLPNGQMVTKKPQSKHHCYYHGTVRNSNSSSVAIDTCSGISGVFVIDSETFYIEPLRDSQTDHLVYKPKDVQLKKKFIDDAGIYKHPDDQEYLVKLQSLPRQKRDAFTETKFIELVIVADKAEYTKNDESVEKTEERCKKVANIMDMTYKPLNIRVALKSVEVWSDSDKIIFDPDASKTMIEFQRWRRDYLLKKVKHDNAQFMTGLTFNGSTVGMASLSSMCSVEKSAGVNEDHSLEAAGVASTMCHEMGHNMGFYHDESTCTCPESREKVGCVMGPVSSSIPPTVWSECTKEYLQTSLEKGLASCLFNYPDTIFDGPICGNGYVEEGEQCDCGSTEYCDNPCCVPETCMLHENATCAVGECCEDCKLKTAGNLCRAKVNECDLPEYCTGQSKDCPSNVYIQNGGSCMSNSKEASCYDGQCITYDNMCKTLWGDVSKQGFEKCYEYNKNGNNYGNCGTVINGDDESFVECAQKDIMCGKLFCEGGPTYPIIGSFVRSQVVHAYDDNGKQHKCKAASVDFGTDVPDPGLVVDGAPCAPDSICSDFKCKTLTELGIKPCQDNCNGRGVCNSNNNCHCDSNWGPPLCNVPGYGGSIDSGPIQAPGPTIVTIPTIVTVEFETEAPDSKGSTVIIIVMLLVVLPVLGLLGLAAYLKRDFIASKWKLIRKDNYQHPKHSTNAKQLRKPETAPGQSLSIEHKVPLGQSSYSDPYSSGYSSGTSSKHSSSTSAASDIPTYPMNFSPTTATVEFVPARPAPARPAPSRPTPPKPVQTKPDTPARPKPPPSALKPSVAPRTNDASYKHRVPPKLPALRPTYTNTNNSGSSSIPQLKPPPPPAKPGSPPVKPVSPPPKPVSPPPKPVPQSNLDNKPKVLPKPTGAKPVVHVKPQPRPRSYLSSPSPPV